MSISTNETIHLDTLIRTAKRLDRFFFFLGIVLFYAFQQGLKVSKVNEKIKLTDDISFVSPTHYYWILFIVCSTLFTIIGFNLLNYIVVRFRFDMKPIPTDINSIEDKTELVPINLYEFLYQRLLGKHIMPSILQDPSRWLFRILVFVCLLAALCIVLFSAYKLYNLTYNYSIVLGSIPFALCLIFIPLVLSFHYTIKRRKDPLIAKNEIKPTSSSLEKTDRPCQSESGTLQSPPR